MTKSPRSTSSTIPMPLARRDRDRDVLTASQELIERSRRLLQETAPLLGGASEAQAAAAGADEG